MALEKGDLVRIIFNTRPISNDNEMYYRRNRTKPAERTGGTDDDRKSFSFSNMMQELFTPSSNNPESNSTANSSQQSRREEEQRQRQEQARRMQQQQQQQQQQAQARQQAQQNAQRQRQAERERLDRQQREQYMRQQQEQQRQRQSNNTSQQRPPTQPSPPIPNTENLLSLHDMIKSNIDPASLSVRTLKSILKANYVEQSHVIEKSELVKLVIRLVDSYKAEHDSNSGSDNGTGGGGGSGNEDTLCRICMDAQQNCVFLDCGHMVTCMDCAKKLIESKNECPICREPILKLVHVFRS
ncbi:hypothetical protein HMPREF1544_03167 [Mucor circinelloides 1006PhL]|uniref:RING-type domain-containing protein n=1 Tax=Mucor circinelloides f. circinelloides (strain 1006PhL) TaxID=1220926 RepID=S2KCM9_MUCC1|nr:hypothetical protein HMPREF1544_03167 [Mucor circinelloides 1006PhL]